MIDEGGADDTDPLSGDPSGGPAKKPMPLEEAIQAEKWTLDLVSRYGQMIKELATLHAAPGPPTIKHTATIQAVVAFISPRHPCEDRAVLALQSLLLPAAAKQDGDRLRGMVAAAVYILRSADLDLPEINAWLTRELAGRKLEFLPNDATGWFHRCTEGRMPPDAIAAFKSFLPALPLPLAEESAKRQARDILDTVAVSTAAPLRGKTRRRGQ